MPAWKIRQRFMEKRSSVNENWIQLESDLRWRLTDAFCDERDRQPIILFDVFRAPRSVQRLGGYDLPSK